MIADLYEEVKDDDLAIIASEMEINNYDELPMDPGILDLGCPTQGFGFGFRRELVSRGICESLGPSIAQIYRNIRTIARSVIRTSSVCGQIV